MVSKKIARFKTAKHLALNPERLALFELSACPHRTALGKRNKELPDMLRLQRRKRHACVTEELTRVDAMRADSSLMPARGNGWHQQPRDKGELPGRNIATDAHRGQRGCGQWVDAYRLHGLVSGCPEAASPFDSVAAANKDDQVFKDELAPTIPQQTEVLFADSGCDDEACYALCDRQGIRLTTPSQAKKNTPVHRLERGALYDVEVREAFCLKTAEPFQGRPKFV